MDPPESRVAQLRRLRNLLADRTLMEELIAEESHNEQSTSHRVASDSNTNGNLSVEMQETQIFNAVKTSASLSEASATNQNEISNANRQVIINLQQHQADDVLGQQRPKQAQKAQKAQNHPTTSTHKPQHTPQSSTKTHRNDIQKRGTARVVPASRVAKQTKSQAMAMSAKKKPPKAKSSVFQSGRTHDENGLYSEQLDRSSVPRRFVVGLDFGTTTTAVSYYAHPVDEPTPRVFADDVKSIMNWPNDDTNEYMSGLMKQVPTLSWYSPFQKIREPFAGQFDSSGFDVISRENSDSSDDDYDKEEDNDRDYGEDGDEDYAESPTSRPFSLKRKRLATDHSLGFDVLELENNESDEFGHYLWGYEVPNALYLDNITRDPNLRLERMKSMLVRSEYLNDDKAALRTRLDFLIDKKLIRKYGKKEVPIPRDVQDAIADFLTQVLKHTGKQLAVHEDLTSECPVTFVATVPVIWSPLSSRVLQYAMEEAIKNSGFGTTLGNGSIDNLYITTEPQAAATYLLAASRKNILPGDTIVVLDCGGGTVDASTHEVNSSSPLTLKRQIGIPNGDNCGGTYLNDRYAKRLLFRLREEHYLDRRGQTRDKIVNGFIPAFETKHKRRKDIFDRPKLRLPIPGLIGDEERGLRGSAAKRFESDVMVLNLEDFQYVFLPILERVGKVLRKQLEECLAKRKTPKKVFVVGGFGQCPSLINYLRQFLQTFSEETCLAEEIMLVDPINHHDSSTTVTCGSVLDHLNLNAGHSQQRLAHSSFGFLRSEPYEPDEWRGHELATPFRDKCDGELYVRVIDYFMIKDKPIARKQTFKPLRSIHAFRLNRKELICEEVVFVNDFPTESHYTLGHDMNKSVTNKKLAVAQVSDKIKINMTHLKTQKKLQPVYPEPDEDGVIIGKPHYKVEFDLFPIAEDRNLRYEARDPETGDVLAMGQVSIAAAFLPGTF